MNEVACSQDGPVFTVLLNRAHKRNSLSEAVAANLAEAFESVPEREGVRVVVITGAGDKAFCAGGDLKPGADGSPFEIRPERPQHPFARMLKAADACPVPVVARVNGAAFGGGLGLVCAADIAIGVRSATFGLPEARLGIFPFMIMPYLLRVMPYRKVMELAFTAGSFDASEALANGVLGRVVDDEAALDAAVQRVVQDIVACSPVALRLGRHAVNATRHLPSADALSVMHPLLSLSALTTDAKEGFASFGERRKPVWSTPRASDTGTTAEGRQ